MPITFNCNGCGKQFTVKDTLAGKSGKRAGCGAPIRIPALDEDPYEVATPSHPVQAVAEPPPPVPAPDKPFPFPVLDDELPAAGPAISIADSLSLGFPQRVVVVNFDMKFATMVKFMVKLALASIPAAIVLWILSLLLFSLVWIMLLAMGLLGGAAVNSMRATVPSPAPRFAPLPPPVPDDADRPDLDPMPQIKRRRP